MKKEEQLVSPLHHSFLLPHQGKEEFLDFVRATIHLLNPFSEEL
jgi:hypothetical protein